MPTLHHHGEVDAEAADWAAKVDAGATSAAEAERLELWLRADRRHRGAFARAQAILHAASQLNSDDVRAPRRAMNRRALLAGGGLMAASLAAGAVYLARREPVLRLSTRPGETRRVTLSDGSTAVLDSRSRLDAVLSSQTRRLTLNAGEAWLSTTQDAARPLLLDIGDIQARTVAAAELVVRLRDGETRLTVVQGIVDAWTTAAPREVRQFGAGAELTLAAATRSIMVGRVTAEALERRLGWRDGLLILNGETLAEAAREFNHYNDLQIEVSGGTADLRVVGAFRNTDPQAFAGTMHDLFGVGVRRLPDRITITDARVVS